MKKRLSEQQEFEIMKLVLDKFLWLGFILMAFGVYQMFANSISIGLIWFIGGVLCYNINNNMLRKINNYHLFILILIVFILNTILFRSIDITKAQWQPPSGAPGESTANIVTSPLSANLDLGGQSIIGNGGININGNSYFSGPIGIGTIA